MIEQTDLAGRFTLPGTGTTVNRMGYGAMQLDGPGVFGPPRDVDAAIRCDGLGLDSGRSHRRPRRVDEFLAKTLGLRRGWRD